MAKATKNEKRLARHARVRKHISGTPEDQDFAYSKVQRTSMLS